MLAFALAGCPGFGERTLTELNPPTPTPPTWANAGRDVLLERCAGCHTVPQRGGAPTHFRLDAYDEAEAGGLRGAYEMRERIMARAVMAGTMPPKGPLGDAERALLGEWIMAGAPRGAP